MGGDFHMIQIIYGKKGSGKTKRIIDMANEAVKAHEGSIVFIDDDNSYMFELRHQIRFINATEYAIKNTDQFLGFLGGILASNYDLSLLFIDGFLRIINEPLDQMESFFELLEQYAEKAAVTLVLSVSGPDAEAPDFIKKYVI